MPRTIAAGIGLMEYPFRKTTIAIVRATGTGRPVRLPLET